MPALSTLAKPNYKPLQVARTPDTTTAQTAWNQTQAGQGTPLGNIGFTPTTPGGSSTVNGRTTLGSNGFQFTAGANGGSFGFAPNSSWGGDDNGIFQNPWTITDSTGKVVRNGVGSSGDFNGLGAGQYTLNGGAPGALLDFRANNAPYDPAAARLQSVTGGDPAAARLMQQNPGMGVPRAGMGNVAGTPQSNGGGFNDGPIVGGSAGGNTGGAAGAAVPSAAGNVDWSKLDISKFMDPNVDYRIQKGTSAIQNSAAAKGGLLSGNTLRGISDYANNEAGAAYGQAQNAAFQDRDFMRGTYANDRDYSTALNEWNQNFAQNQYQYGNDFGERQRQFNTGTDLADRQFDYNAQVGDRQFNYNSLSNLANMGLQGNQNSGQLASILASLNSNNLLTGAGANAAGQMGGATATNNLISQLLRYFGG